MSDCKVILFALNAAVDTTSENVRANMNASRSTSKSVSCEGRLSDIKSWPSLTSNTGTRLFLATSVNASAVSER